MSGWPGGIAGRFEIQGNFRTVGLLQDVIGEYQTLGSRDCAELAYLPERQAFEGIAVVLAERLAEQFELRNPLVDFDCGKLRYALAG